MGGQSDSKGKTITIALSLLIFVFYCVIIEYVMFGIVNIHLCKNYICGMIFGIIGFVILLLQIGVSVIKRGYIKLGYLVPMVTITVVYTVLLNVLNIWGSIFISSVFFTLLHMVLLFLYLLIVVPMFIMGKQ